MTQELAIPLHCSDEWQEAGNRFAYTGIIILFVAFNLDLWDVFIQIWALRLAHLSLLPTWWSWLSRDLHLPDKETELRQATKQGTLPTCAQPESGKAEPQSQDFWPVFCHILLCCAIEYQDGVVKTAFWQTEDQTHTQDSIRNGSLDLPRNIINGIRYRLLLKYSMDTFWAWSGDTRKFGPFLHLQRLGKLLGIQYCSTFEGRGETWIFLFYYGKCLVTKI